jgi:acyl-CoA thioesterase YciA
MPGDTNPAGDIFGGWLVAQMDLAAGSAAARMAQGRCVTVSIEKVTFLKPVHVGDEVSVYVDNVAVGRTSIKFHVEAWSRSRDGDTAECVANALVVFVAIDSGGRPRHVPRPV